MIITGKNFRNIYPQESLNWDGIFSPLYNSSGEFNFSFSGVNGLDLVFKLKNNKIFSPSGDLIGGYNQEDKIGFSGNIDEKSLDLYKNNYPLYLGLNRKTTGILSNFIVESINGNNVDIESLTVYGIQPQYFFNSNLIYQTGVSIPVNIYNSGKYPIYIYSGEITTVGTTFELSGLSSTLTVPAIGSNNFYLNSKSPETIISQEIIFLNLYTNLGTENLVLNITGLQPIQTDLFYISIGPPVTTIFNNTFNEYLVSFANESGSDLLISFNYISGITGNYYKPILQTGYTQNLISGNVSGSGFITGLITGYVSGYNTLNNQWETGTGTGIGYSFKISDDKNVTGFYNTVGTGKGYVEFFTDVKASGYVSNILYSGYVSIQGGFLTGNTGVYGTGQLLDQQYEGNISGSALIFSPYTGAVLASFNSDEYDNLLLSAPLKYVTGNFNTGLKNIAGFGYATGRRITGFLQGDFGENDYEPGFYRFEKPFDGAATGLVIEYSGLNPVQNTISGQITTGFVSTTIIHNLIAQGCKINLNIDLTGTGIPNSIKKINNTGIVFPVNIFNTLPIYSGIEFPNDNLNFQTGSGTVVLYPNYPTGGRTRISRPGPTSSGTGFFDNLFQVPFFSGNSGFAQNFYGWKESLTSNIMTGELPGKSVSVAYLSGLINLFGENDTSIIDFTLTGAQKSVFNNVKFYFDTKETGRYIITDFYKNNVVTGRKYSGLNIGLVSGVTDTLSGDFNIINSTISGNFYYASGGVIYNITSPTDTIVQIINLGLTGQEFLFQRSGGATAYFQDKLMGNNFFVVNDILPDTGDYRINMYYKDFTPALVSGSVSFSHSVYTGCEKDRAFVFKITKTGNYPFFQTSGSIIANFTGPNYPVLNDSILRSGIKWNWSLDSYEFEKYYGFYIYLNNRYQTNWGGNLSLVISGYTFNDPLLYLNLTPSISSASFIVTDDDKLECCPGSTCTGTIDSRNDFILPINNADLGQDFLKVDEVFPPPDFPITGPSIGSSEGSSIGAGAGAGAGSSVGSSAGPAGNSNPPPSSLNFNIAGDSATPVGSCLEQEKMISVELKDSGLECARQYYKIRFWVCAKGMHCEGTESDHALVYNGQVYDLGEGGSTNICADSPIAFTWKNFAFNSFRTVKGQVRVTAWFIDPNETIPFPSRNTVTRTSSVRIQNTTWCDCCKYYSLKEKDDTCPPGYTLTKLNNKSCPEGQRACYHCKKDSTGAGLLNNIDYLLDILNNN